MTTGQFVFSPEANYDYGRLYDELMNRLSVWRKKLLIKRLQLLINDNTVQHIYNKKILTVTTICSFFISKRETCFAVR